MSQKVLVSVGSYERVVYGLDLEYDGQSILSSKLSFAIPAHLGMVKSIASCARYLVSGGSDENIKVFDLRRRRDLGTVPEHAGTITCLAFHGDRHLLSAGLDGALALFRTRDWECLHVMTQKKAVLGLAIHPTGKLALSLGEKELFVWNLVAGKRAHRQRLSFVAERVAFSPSGLAYALLGDRHLELHQIGGGGGAGTGKSKTGKTVNTEGFSAASVQCELPSRALAMVWLNDRWLLVLGETERGYLLDTTQSNSAVPLLWVHGQAPRVKDAQLTASRDLLCLGSSSGAISLWSASQLIQAAEAGKLDDTLQPLLVHQTGLRITCLTATPQ